MTADDAEETGRSPVRAGGKELDLIGLLPAGLLRCFPFPWRHRIGVGPQAFAGSPGELFDHLEAGIAGCRSLPPGQPFFQQLAPHIAPVMQ